MCESILRIIRQRSLAVTDRGIDITEQSLRVAKAKVGKIALIHPDVVLGSARFVAHANQITEDVIVELARDSAVKVGQLKVFKILSTRFVPFTGHSQGLGKPKMCLALIGE